MNEIAKLVKLLVQNGKGVIWGTQDYKGLSQTLSLESF